MRFVNFLGLILSPLIVVLACTSGKVKTQGWSLNMRGMAESYEKLIPYMYDSQRFSDPNNEKFINLYLKQLNQNASDLDRHTAKGLSGNDPLFIVGLRGLKTQIQKATESYFVESYSYSQELLQSSVNYCNSCHSRTNIGPTFIKWDQFEEITSKLPPLDYANILVATRQFPKTIKVLQEGLYDKKSSEEERDEMVKKMMTVSLKNLGAPDQALGILNDTPKNKVSKSLAKEFPQWKSYLTKWKAGKQKSSLKSILNKKNVTGSHFVETLHHSLVLHNSLSTEKDASVRAETYHALGKIYIKYPEMGSWNLPETYFETCIYQNPGSKVAKKCYYDLEGRLKGYPPSKQTPLLKIEQAKLNTLKAVADKKPGENNKMSGGFGFEDL